MIGIGLGAEPRLLIAAPADYLRAGIGDTLANAIDGGAGNDTLAGGAGADSLTGGSGTDTADYSASLAAVSVSLVAAVNGVGGDAAGDVYSGIENLIGSAQEDTLTGEAGANTLDGGSGNDLINGAAGNDNLLGNAGADTLIGGAGADTLSGGAGTDVADYSSSTAVTVSLASGSGQGRLIRRSPTRMSWPSRAIER